LAGFLCRKISSCEESLAETGCVCDGLFTGRLRESHAVLAKLPCRSAP
jgi:hypothetical protein